MQSSQEAGKVVWYSHLFKNFPQFAVIHMVKDFTVVCEAEVDIFVEFSCFFYAPTNVGNLISRSSTFPKFSLNIWRLLVHTLLKSSFSCVQLYVTLWTIAHHAPLSMGFSSKITGVGCHALLQGIFSTQGSN